MRKSKMILICILTIIMMLFVSTTNVFALLDDGDDVTLDPGDSGDDDDDDDNGSRQPIQYPEDPEDPNEVEQPDGKDNTSNKNNVNGMPDTGLEDAPIIAIVICVVAASIGYTQIIKYNKY